MAAISLDKGTTVSLKKSDGGNLSRVVLGLGWDPVKKGGLFGKITGGNIDLDASAILLGGGQVKEIVSFSNLRSGDGSVRHAGDNLTGAGNGDDEQIAVELSTVPAGVDSIVFVITSFGGHKFSDVENVFCRLVDATTNQELVRYNLREQPGVTGMVMAKVYRDGNGWSFKAVGTGANARVASKLANEALSA